VKHPLTRLAQIIALAVHFIIRLIKQHFHLHSLMYRNGLMEILTGLLKIEQFIILIRMVTKVW